MALYGPTIDFTIMLGASIIGVSFITMLSINSWLPEFFSRW